MKLRALLLVAVLPFAAVPVAHAEGKAAAGAKAAPVEASPHTPLLMETIGGVKDGFVPKLFTALKRDLSPEDAGKLVPGFESPSKYGFAKVAVSDKPGVERVEAYFRDMDQGKPKLFSLRILFSKSLATPEFYKELVRVCEAKYGKAKPDQVEKQLVTWANRQLATAQISKDPTTGAYMVNVTLPRR